jgi:hypothetical protein
MITTIDPETPRLAAEWLKPRQWTRGVGDRKTSGCLTTAVLAVCGDHPGDQYLWRGVLRYRNRAERFNDRVARDKQHVLNVLQRCRVPSEEEMAKTFGPQWKLIRNLVRRAAMLTAEESKQLAGALPVIDKDASGVYGTAIAQATQVIHRVPSDSYIVANAASSAANAAAAAATVDGSAAAYFAARALAVRDLIGQHGFTQEHYDTLTNPWKKVFGKVHPDD